MQKLHFYRSCGRCVWLVASQLPSRWVFKKRTRNCLLTLNVPRNLEQKTFHWFCQIRLYRRPRYHFERKQVFLDSSKNEVFLENFGEKCLDGVPRATLYVYGETFWAKTASNFKTLSSIFRTSVKNISMLPFSANFFRNSYRLSNTCRFWDFFFLRVVQNELYIVGRTVCFLFKKSI